jgi:glutamine synthetase
MGIVKEPTDAAEFLANQNPLVNTVKLIITEHKLEVIIAGAADLNGIFRGERIPATRFILNPLASVAISDAFWVVDPETELEPKEPGYEGWWPSWDLGFGDVMVLPDLSTFRIVPWLDRTGLVLCDHFLPDGKPIEIAPRRLLRHVVERAAPIGQPAFAAELEFFLYNETPKSLAAKGYRAQSLEPVTIWPEPYGIYTGTVAEQVLRPLTRHLEAFGLPVECWNPEGGAGQFEINTRFSPLPEAADHAFLFKHAVREIAFQHGMTATFMAKPLPGFGSSCHVHQSIWADGVNLLWDSDATDRLSETAKHYIGGLVSSLRDFTLLFAPNVNSYKRMMPESAAGTTATWGYENRTTGLRVLHEDAAGCRIENRVAGADANPYLVMAACLAGGMWGIDERIAPPEPIKGNAYGNHSLALLPTSLEQAIAAFESSIVAKKYLGEEFVAFYAATRKWELEQFRANITDWEIKRYLPFV